jgi:hypothetical protein
VKAAELLPFDGHDLERRESWLGEKLTRSDFESLPQYDTTIPSGVIIGKRWRRTDADGDWVGDMVRSDNWQGVEIVFRPVVFVAAG